MRLLKLTLSSLAVTLVLCAPALAQNSPAASQYSYPIEPESCGTATNVACAQSVTDGVHDIVDNAKQGTGVVNGAMNDAVEAPAASASASPEAVLSAETGASPESSSSPDALTAGGETDDAETDRGGTGEDMNDGDTGEEGGEGEGPAMITVLPETGGASPAILGLGVLLVAAGLMFRRSS